jgi:putative two-component system response regulator
MYHDIGKLIIPPDILNKPAPLDAAEWVAMRRHPGDGVAMFRELMAAENHQGEAQAFLLMCEEVIEGHHERWDGQGYPRGLKERETPMLARLCAIADTYDAITTNRVYHRADSHDRACHVIRTEAGKQFDPGLVEVFMHCQIEFAATRGRSAPRSVPRGRQSTDSGHPGVHPNWPKW